MSYFNGNPHLDGTMYNYEKLIAAIEQLENENVISFDEFEKLPFHEIHKQYFSTPHPTMMAKAKMMIRNKRDGKTGSSSYYSVTIIHDEEKTTRITRTHIF